MNTEDVGTLRVKAQLWDEFVQGIPDHEALAFANAQVGELEREVLGQPWPKAAGARRQWEAKADRLQAGSHLMCFEGLRTLLAERDIEDQIDRRRERLGMTR